MAIHRVNGRAWNVETRGAKSEMPLVLLHGFTGSAAEMLQAAEHLPGKRQLIAVDLPGHGASDDATTWDDMLSDLHKLVKGLAEGATYVWGYSQGGRVALAYAAKFRDSLLVLESASPGLATEAERAERVRSDEALASRIEQIGTEAFLDEWEALPMFAGERARPARVAHRASGLASALRVLGTGAQPSQWDGLAEVGPSLLITGERDAKFTAIAAKMETMMPRALRRTIPGAGHAPHREAPEATVRALATFL